MIHKDIDIPIRVIVNGAKGKMGQEAVLAINKDPEFLLVAEAGRDDDLSALIANTQAQVVLDLTVASTVYQNACLIVAAGARPVIGTSGLLPEQIQALKVACAKKNLGGIIAPNFAIGAVLMMRFAQQAAQYYSHCEIIEMHHAHKQDTPSGTALKTASLIAEVRAEQAASVAQKETVPGARGAQVHGIAVHAVRLPGIVASQEVLFGGEQETLSIREQTIHRSAFMPGIKLACKKVLGLSELVYGLEHIL